LPEFRRLGLAAGLMEEVQRQMEAAHGGEGVSLHVRCSNAAALRLYGPHGLGYCVEQTIEVRGRGGGQ
jgi:ribosomal protein S18 acetylase RimI-like enzyme